VNIRIVNPPAGEAPDSVRAAWVGLVLPIDGPPQSRPRRTIGVVTGPKTFLATIFAMLLGRMKIESGYQVRSAIAIELLSKHAPDAAAWWRENTPHFLQPNRFFIFQDASCVVEQADQAAG